MPESRRDFFKKLAGITAAGMAAKATAGLKTTEQMLEEAKKNIASINDQPIIEISESERDPCDDYIEAGEIYGNVGIKSKYNLSDKILTNELSFNDGYYATCCINTNTGEAENTRKQFVKDIKRVYLLNRKNIGG